jgi:histidine triad (HIT) family protein
MLGLQASSLTWSATLGENAAADILALVQAMTIFDHLIAGRIPASFVHQDAVCVAFMDLKPMARGHVLVVPRQSVPTLAELDVATRAHLWEIALRVGCGQQQALGSLAQHFLVNDGKAASQSVPHVHIHVIPRYRGDGMRTVYRMIAHLATLYLRPKESPGLRAILDSQARAIAQAIQS